MPSVFKILAFVFVLVSSLKAADPVEFSVGSFTFARPAGWTWVVPSSPMRKAQLAVPENGQEAGEVTFFHFGPNQGGGVKANVDRWLAQFQNPVSDTRTEKVGAVTITFVGATGTFSSGMPGGPTTPKEGFALQGAILESAQGDVFVKFTGVESLVKSSAPAFEKMIRDAAGR